MASNESLVALIQSGRDQKENLQRLYDQNKGLIRKVVNHFEGMAEPDDLEQEGYVALHAAAHDYDDSKGASFATFAMARIKWHLLRYIETSRAVHVSIGAYQQIRLRYKTIEDLTHRHGREATNEEIRRAMGLTRQQYNNILKALSAGNLDSLDAPLKEEGGDSLYEIVPTAEDVAESVTDEATAANLEITLWETVDKLPANQAAVIKERYQKGRRLIDVSADFETLGLNYNQTKEIERAGLKSLRSPRYRRLYEQYLPDFYRAHAYRGSGVGCFRETWTSSTERVALQKIEHDTGRDFS